ncbi:MAG TPA: hypothetical protein VM511_12940, partial [Luteolibacter sp.]|nr:hypothetical protein [Luteolibacter sp.]
MHRKLSVLIAFVLVTPSFALTDASKTELAKLVEAVRTESAGMQGDRENQRYVQGFIRELERHAGSESSVQLDQTLSQYAGYFRTKEVADAITSLQTRLTEERKQADDLYARNLETLLKKASDAVSTAKEPADLDEIITQLGKVDRNEYRAYNQSGIVPENIQRLLAVVSPARSFVEKWQDYLAAMKSNDFRAARLVLKTLVQGERGDPGFVPRSEILAKLQELSGTRERAVKIIAGINTLEEIGDKVALLQSFSTEYDGSGPGIHDLIAALVPINKSYRDFLGGMPVMVDVDNQSYAQLPKDVAAKVMDLRKLLLILVLPRYVGAPEGTKAAPDETVAAFLDRIAA